MQILICNQPYYKSFELDNLTVQILNDDGDVGERVVGQQVELSNLVGKLLGELAEADVPIDADIGEYLLWRHHVPERSWGDDEVLVVLGEGLDSDIGLSWKANSVCCEVSNRSADSNARIVSCFDIYPSLIVAK